MRAASGAARERHQAVVRQVELAVRTPGVAPKDLAFIELPGALLEAKRSRYSPL